MTNDCVQKLIDEDLTTVCTTVTASPFNCNLNYEEDMNIIFNSEIMMKYFNCIN